jgi:hypothetical protein
MSLSNPDHTAAVSECRALYEEVWHTPSPTLELARSQLMKPASLSLTLEERTRLTYLRARALARAYSKFPCYDVHVSGMRLIGMKQT